MRKLDLSNGKVFHTVELDATHSRTMLIPFKQIFHQVVLNPDASTIPVEVQAFRIGGWNHPAYGKVDITPQVFDDMLKNYRENVYGQDLSITYEHGLDNSKGLQAAGWVKGVNTVDGRLSYSIEFTKEALQEIKDGKWRYFSPEYVDEWTDPESKQKYSNVLVGGSLTNAPFFKGMQPLNFSDLFTEVEEDVEDEDDLPDSSFLYIAPGGQKDDEGDTVPKSLRMFPYKDEDGETDWTAVAALPSAISSSSLSDDIKAALTQAAESINAASPIDPNEGVNELTFREQLLKFAKELNVTVVESDTDEQIETKCFSALKAQQDELEPLRKLREEHSAAKSFSEQFPEQARRMAELEAVNRESEARAFSENYQRFYDLDGEGETASKKPNTKGFSALALDKIKDMRKAFSEHTATPEMFSEILDLVASGAGIVDYGTRGSTLSSEDDKDTPRGGTQDARKAFSEFVKTVGLREENKGKQFNELVHIAATENPELFDAYQQPIMAGRN